MTDHPSGSSNTQVTTDDTHATRRRGFGVDIGGSGVKGAIVDLDTGELLSERFKILTPKPATPEAVADVVAELMRMADWDGDIGITVPAVVQHQHTCSAANIDKSWIGLDLQELFTRHLGRRKIAVLNDADAAGIAESRFGDERAREGSVIMLTFGTGIGSAMLVDGVLYPNSELGHLPHGDGSHDIEYYASSAAKDREELSYKKWAKRVSEVMQQVDKLFSPKTFIVGGGISRKHEKWVPLLNLQQPVIPAKLLNQAGIVGAAIAVDEGITP